MMNRLLLLLLLLCALSTKTTAQLEIKAGANLSKITDSYPSKYGFGAQAGAAYDLRLSEHFAFQPQMLLLYETYSQESSFNNYYYEGDAQAFSAYVPLLFSYKYQRLRFDLGPYLTCGLWGELKNEINNNGEYSKITSDLFSESNRSRIETGVTCGVGYEICKNISLTGHVKYAAFVNGNRPLTFMLSIGYKIKT